MIYRFYHVTDTHYYSKKNIACDPKSLPQYEGQISFRESEEIVKKAFEINPTSGGIVKHKELFRLLNGMKKINTV